MVITFNVYNIACTKVLSLIRLNGLNKLQKIYLDLQNLQQQKIQAQNPMSNEKSENTLRET